MPQKTHSLPQDASHLATPYIGARTDLGFFSHPVANHSFLVCSPSLAACGERLSPFAGSPFLWPGLGSLLYSQEPQTSAQEPQTTHRSGTSNYGGSQQGEPASGVVIYPPSTIWMWRDNKQYRREGLSRTLPSIATEQGATRRRLRVLVCVV